MNPPGPSPPSASELACEVCGTPGAVRIADRSLCTTCYTACGSCCAEFQEADEVAEAIKRIARDVAAGR